MSYAASESEVGATAEMMDQACDQFRAHELSPLKSLLQAMEASFACIRESLKGVGHTHTPAYPALKDREEVIASIKEVYAFFYPEAKARVSEYKLAEMCPDVEVQFQPDEQTEEVLEQVHAASAEIKARLRFLPQHAIDTMQDTLDMFLPPKFLDISKLLVEVDSVRCFIFTALNANPSSEGKGNEADWGAVLELLDCLGFVLEKLYGALLTAPQFGGVGGSDSDSDSDAESDSDDYDDDGDDAEEDGGFISDEDAGSE